jgi:hypothetical protein
MIQVMVRYMSLITKQSYVVKQTYMFDSVQHVFHSSVTCDAFICVVCGSEHVQIECLECKTDPIAATLLTPVSHLINEFSKTNVSRSTMVALSATPFIGQQVANFADNWQGKTLLLTYLLTYLLIYLLTYLFTYLLLTYLLIYLFTYSRTYSLTYLLTYLLTDLLTYVPTYLLTYSLIYLLTYLLT